MPQFVEIICQELWPDFRAETIIRMNRTNSIFVIFFEELFPRGLETDFGVEVGRSILGRRVLNS